MKKRKIAAAVLAAVMLLSGCAEENDSEMNTPETAVREKVDYVFRKTEVLLPDGYQPYTGTSISYSGGEFRFDTLLNRDSGSKTVFSADLSGMTKKVEQMAGDIVPLMEMHYAADSWEMSDGRILCAELGAGESGNVTDVYLTCRSETGSMIFCIELPSYFGYVYKRDEFYHEDMGFYIYDCIEADDRIILLTNLGLCALSGSGTKLWMNTEHREHYALMDTEIGILYYSKTGGLRMVNPYDGSLSGELPFPEELIQGTQYGHFVEILTGEGHDIYIKNTVGIYGVDFVTDEEGNTVSESRQILNWLNSDIVHTEVENICIGDPETVMIIMSDPFVKRHDNPRSILYICRKASEDEIEEKEIIHLLQVGYNYYLNTAAALFNERSETHRVVITDYTSYDDVEMRRQYMNAEMAAGRVPDVIFYGDSMNRDTTMRDYMESGVFADLVPLMKADETFDYDDLLGYVKNPYTNSKGEQYLMPYNPSAGLYYVRPGYTDGIMTAEEALDVFENLPEDKAMTTADRLFLWDIMDYEIQRRIDFENYTCSFDDSEFASMIERIRSGIDNWHIVGNFTSGAAYINGFMKEDYAMYSASFNDIEYIPRMKYYLGDDLVVTGLPNNAGKMVADEASSSYLAVSEASKCKEAAFELLETIMIVKRDLGEGELYFRSDIDNKYELMKDTVYVVEKNGTISVYRDGKAPEGVEDHSYRVAKEDCQALKAILDSIEDCAFADNRAYLIAYEEIFSGDPSRSGEEIAEIVQSRVSL
ncbi:MAG: hypothetical protein IKI93_07150, partial [Clostridia bacterium]|nr:hypothetical protein [Clostridia bacterium]